MGISIGLETNGFVDRPVLQEKRSSGTFSFRIAAGKCWGGCREKVTM